jgi:hypothetical protein
MNWLVYPLALLGGVLCIKFWYIAVPLIALGWQFRGKFTSKKGDKDVKEKEISSS